MRDAESAVARTPDVRLLRASAQADGERNMSGPAKFRLYAAERGISWSDTAILLRSVKANGEPITTALVAGRYRAAGDRAAAQRWRREFQLGDKTARIESPR